MSRADSVVRKDGDTLNLAVRMFILTLLTVVVAKSYGSTLPFLS